MSETTFQKQSVLNYINVFHLINSVFQNKESLNKCQKNSYMIYT